jgi:hypothetical protein
MPLDKDAALRAMTMLGQPLKVEPLEVAVGFFDIVMENVATAVRPLVLLPPGALDLFMATGWPQACHQSGPMPLRSRVAAIIGLLFSEKQGGRSWFALPDYLVLRLFTWSGPLATAGGSSRVEALRAGSTSWWNSLFRFLPPGDSRRNRPNGQQDDKYTGVTANTVPMLLREASMTLL